MDSFPAADASRNQRVQEAVPQASATTETSTCNTPPSSERRSNVSNAGSNSNNLSTQASAPPSTVESHNPQATIGYISLVTYAFTSAAIAIDQAIPPLIVGFSVIGSAVWYLRECHHCLEPISSFCFDAVEMALKLRVAYRPIVDMLKERRDRMPHPTPRQWTHRDIETGHGHELPLYPSTDAVHNEPAHPAVDA